MTSLAALLVLTGLALLSRHHDDDHRLTVIFASTTSLYRGAQVKVLGVRVGTVESIRVVGDHVEVTMSYRDDVRLPADVHAVVVPPSVVGDRFVQLTPAYTSGPVLADGAHLGLAHSGVPLELDDTYRALDQVATSFGPHGANRDGALSRLVSAGADSLRGRGRLFNTTVRELADAIATLAGSSGDINATTTHLADLSTRLAASDTTIRRLVSSLVAVGGELDSQGGALVRAVTALDRALGRVATFTRQNRSTLHRGLADLTSVSSTLRRHTAELEEILDLAPVGLVNLLRTYVPRNWDPTHRGRSSVDGRTGAQNLHAALFQDLDSQLGYTLAALCDRLPPGSAARLEPFCSALDRAGGDLGRVLEQAYHQGAPR